MRNLLNNVILTSLFEKGREFVIMSVYLFGYRIYNRRSVSDQFLYICTKSMVSLGHFLLMLQQNLDGVEEQIQHLESRLNDYRALKQSIIKKIHETEKVNFDDIEL